MPHPTEAELRALGNEILDLLVQKTLEEADSYDLARENQERQLGYEPDPLAGPRTVMAELEGYIRDAYSWLPDTYAKFAEPRPEEFDPLIEQCATTLMLLQPSMEAFSAEGQVYAASGNASDIAAEYPTTISERVDAVKGQVIEWEGTAANAFNQNYLGQFPDSLRFQHDAVFALAAAMEANKKIFANVGQDILHIGEQTKEALRHVTDKDPTGWTIALTVVAAVATVAATAATGGAAIAFAVVAAGGSAAAGIIGATAEEPLKVEDGISGATTQQIMVSMVDRISQLYEKIDQQEDKIVNGLNVTLGHLDGMKTEIELPLPESYMGLDDASYEELQDEFMRPG